MTNEGGYAVGDYNREVLCTDSPGSCVVWSASAGMWSPDPATACWGEDALCTPVAAPQAQEDISSANIDNLLFTKLAQELGIAAAARVNNNPILRIGRGFKEMPDGTVRRIWRIASGGRLENFVPCFVT